MLKFLLPLFALLAVSACNKKIVDAAAKSGDVKMVAYDQPEELAPGQGLSFTKGATAFTFLEVVSDSRCPQGVNCVRAGEAVVKLAMADGTLREFVIKAKQKGGPRFTVPDGTVTILGLDPYPVARVETAPEAYRLRVVVAKSAAL